MTDETPNQISSSPGNHAKKRKENENNKKEQQNEQRIECREWDQTDSEVNVILDVGSNVDSNRVSFTCNDGDCIVKLNDGRVWSCVFYGEVIGNGTILESGDSSLNVRFVKKNYGELWPRLDWVGGVQESDKVDDKAESEGGEKETEVPEPPVVRKLEHVKNSWYEQPGVIVVTLYIRNVKKETLKVWFEKQSFRVQFQTSYCRFLRLNSLSTEDTFFTWEIDLKDTIIPNACTYKLTQMVLNINLKKSEMKRWGGLEAPQTGNQGVAVPSNTWVPAATASKPSCTVDAVTATMPAVMMEEDEPIVGSESQLKKSRFPEIFNEDSKIFSESESSCAGETRKAEPTILFNPKKPTCMVSPLNKLHSSEQTQPLGVTGLENLGNTCFMNSVLQCLVNTQEFKQYFVGNYWSHEINTENPLGTGGKLASAFATLMCVLWSGTHKSYSPSKLKNLISMKASQFTGFAQHDAQEFMAFLLDGLHEDLNRIKEKPYSENSTIDCENRPDNVVADEAWALYKRRNDSVVVDLFQGQYKSKLVCPVCAKVSITFDPFLYLSVPLPKKKKMLPVTFFFKDPSRRPIKYYLRLSHNATSDELFTELSNVTGVAQCNLRIFEVSKSKIQKFISCGANLESMPANTLIFVFEVLEESLAGEEIVELQVIQRIIMPRLVTRCSYCRKEAPQDTKLKRCTKCYRVGYCNQTCQRNHWTTHRANCKHVPEPVGFPFIVSLPKSQATYSKICYMMEAYAKYSVYVFQPPVKLHESLSTSSSNASAGSLDSGRASVASSDCSISTTESGIAESETAALSPMSNTSTPGTATTPGDDGYETESESSSLQQHFDKLTSTDTPAAASSPQSGVGTSTRVVYGQPHDKVVERPAQPFTVRYVTQSGQSMSIGGSPRVEDKGTMPLDFESANTHWLAMDWQNNERANNYVLVESKDLECDSDDNYATYMRDDQSNLTLEQCLQLFTEPEKLAPDEAWYCPRCKEQREATKQMSLWRLPTILIVQLKRFSFKNLILRDKIDKTIEFPIRELDLTRYYCGAGSSSDNCPPVYDLYAVINHHGSILGGHYTSFARLVDQQNTRRNEVDWRLFDDSRVSFVAENNVMTRAGYVLFYRRRRAILQLPTQMTAASVSDSECVEEETSERRRTLESNFEILLPMAPATVSKEGLSNAEFESGDSYRNPSTFEVPYTDMEAVD